MIGGLIHKFHLPRYSGFIILTLFGLNIVVEEWLCVYIGKELCEYFYSSIYVQLLSVLVFLYIINIRIRHERIISVLSQLFLPVYTIHIFVIEAVNKILIPYDYWFTPLICWSLVSIMSVALSYLIMKIPFMKTIFKL